MKLLREKLDGMFPHSRECLMAQEGLKRNFNMYSPDKCLEPERKKRIDQLLSLFTEEMEKNNRNTRKCPKCKIGKQDIRAGGNVHCFHCNNDKCAYLECDIYEQLKKLRGMR